MNRSVVFDLCEKHLSILSTRIEVRGKLNLLNLHLHCEDFYAGLLNLLFNYELQNANAYNQNAEGIDLIDLANKIVLQVSATATADKLNSALSKDLSAYAGHGFRFVSISKSADALRKGKFSNPHALVFNPKADIHDVPSLLNKILHKSVADQRRIYEYLRQELSDASSDGIVEESNLAAVVNIIAGESLDDDLGDGHEVMFNVDAKIEENLLDRSVGIISEYKVHHHRVERIYSEFDLQGVNKSKSVLDSFRLTYAQLAGKYAGDDLFFMVAEEMKGRVRKSSNFKQVSLDELELYVNVLTVDAFIRCKIFKEPTGAVHASA